VNEMPNEKKYTSEDFIESEKIHKENYKEIHNLVRNIFDKCQDKNLRTSMIKVLEFIYDKEITCQKDINIEASTSVETEDTSK
jgi:hypothetical protein